MQSDEESPKEPDEPEAKKSLLDSVSLVSVGGFITAVGAIIGAVITIEGRYVKATDYELAQATTELKIDQSALQQRQWLLNDRISNIELKPPTSRNEYENAQYERYKRDLESTERSLRSIEKEQREVKRGK